MTQYSNTPAPTRRGNGFFVFVFLLLLFAVVYFLVRLLPAYYEFWQVSSTIDKVIEDTNNPQDDIVYLAHEIGRRLNISGMDPELVQTITTNIGEKTKPNGKKTLELDYDSIKPLIFNITLNVNFNYAKELPAL